MFAALNINFTRLLIVFSSFYLLHYNIAGLFLTCLLVIPSFDDI